MGGKLNKLQAWRVTAPARLHLGFIDMERDAQRRFGGLGIALDAPVCRVSLSPAPQLETVAGDREKLRALVAQFDRAYGVTSTGRIEVHEEIPRHAGLGSGTQLALAVGHLLARMHGLRLTSRRIAASLRRGQRSGIGVAAFERGHFVVDGGRGAANRVPPLVANIAFPEAWRIVLVLDRQAQGLHGGREENAFNSLPQSAAPSAHRLSHIVLMEILPALAERDHPGFSDALGRFQQTVGDYFAPSQGGRCSSPRVGKILSYLYNRGINGIGQSSWGPTGYAIARDSEQAEEIKALINDAISQDPAIPQSQISLLDTTASRTGGTIEKMKEAQNG